MHKRQISACCRALYFGQICFLSAALCWPLDVKSKLVLLYRFPVPCPSSAAAVKQHAGFAGAGGSSSSACTAGSILHLCFQLSFFSKLLTFGVTFLFLSSLTAAKSGFSCLESLSRGSLSVLEYESTTHYENTVWVVWVFLN